MPLTEVRKEKQVWTGEFCFRYVKFERPSRHPNENAKSTVGYLRLEFREEFQAGDTDFEIIGRELLFKATAQGEITKTVAEKSTCPSTAPSGIVTLVG